MRVLVDGSRVGLIGLLAASGVAAIAGSRERWGAACRGGLESGPCLRVQDSRFDYLLPRDPWEPIGQSADLAALAFALLAAALLLAPALLLRDRPVPARVALGLLLAGCWLPMTWVQWQSARTGIPAEDPAGAGLSALGLVAGLGLLGWLARTGPSRGRRVVVAALFAATPLGSVILAVVLLPDYYDAPPWGEAVGGIASLLAAALTWSATRRPPATDPAEDPGEPVTAQASVSTP